MNRTTLNGTGDVVLECVGVTKRFPGVIANNRVDFSLRKGEIHALLGENGAGKSTLMNCVYGLYAPDEGSIRKDGRELRLKSPADAIHEHIGMIHQHFMLVPTLSVVENVALCLGGGNPLKLNLRSVEKKIRGLSEQYGLDIDPRAKVSDLSVGEQQRVEILKVLYRDAEILIMDEPTAVLTPSEVDGLFAVLRDLTKHENSVIFISHKLWEVMEITDRVTILRDGEKVDTVSSSGMTKEKLAEMMVGREVFLQYDHPAVEKGRTILEVKDVSLSTAQGVKVLDAMNLQVAAGEIVGIAGVDGNGQKELAGVIHGLYTPDSGQIFFDGKDVTDMPVKGRLALGLGHIPEDRLTTGVVPAFSVAENMVLIEFDGPPFTRKGFYDHKAVDERAKALTHAYDIRLSSVSSPIADLSGGNQQKVVLAREITRSPKLLVAAQPTRGLDIGATEFTQRTLIEERTKGSAVLLISTDLDEVLAVSDRVLVIYEGSVIGEVTPGKHSITEIGMMMAGMKQEGVHTDTGDQL